MNIVVIGGAGFIGCNVADYYLKNKHHVTVFDNFSRKGTLQNLRWLQSTHKVNLSVVQGDVRVDFNKLKSTVSKADIVFHLAAQVAVTTSVVDPREDFEINAQGTFNVLEAIRLSGNKPVILYSSTNKVYGGMEHVKIVERNGEYDYESLPLGVGGHEQLDFHSPVRLQQRNGRPIHDRLFEDLWAQDGSLPTVVHLRLPSIRRRGSGMGCPFHNLRDVQPRTFHLRRRQAGPRCVVHRRSCSSLRHGHTAHRCDMRKGVQHRRRTE